MRESGKEQLTLAGAGALDGGGEPGPLSAGSVLDGVEEPFAVDSADALIDGEAICGGREGGLWGSAAGMGWECETGLRGG